MTDWLTDDSEATRALGRAIGDCIDMGMTLAELHACIDAMIPPALRLVETLEREGFAVRPGRLAALRRVCAELEDRCASSA